MIIKMIIIVTACIHDTLWHAAKIRQQCPMYRKNPVNQNLRPRVTLIGPDVGWSPTGP